MIDHCSFCGAPLPAEMTCQAFHDALLIFEMEHKILHSVHFQMVTCFQIQHQHFSDEGLTWARAMLEIQGDERLSEQERLHRLTNWQKGKGQPRTWKFRRTRDARPLSPITWSMTIADIVRHSHDPADYCQVVRQWAEVTMHDMTSWLEP
jgi:hypothetical protein